MKFKIYGHKNVLCTHKNTLEFTKDKDLSLKGDCILGVSADFVFDPKILEFDKVKVSINCDGVSDNFEAEVNKSFDDAHEMVFRITDYVSNRTLGVRSTKAVVDIDRRIVKHLKDENNFAIVRMEGLN